MQTIDQEIDRAIAVVDRYQKQIELCQKRRMSVGEPILLSLFDKLSAAKMHLCNLQLKHIDQITNMEEKL